MTRKIETLLIDLDDTLYRNHEIPGLMKANIKRYMKEKLGIDDHYIATNGELFYMDYGTTLAGLASNGYKVDYEDWHKDVHGALPYDRLLKADPELRRILESLPQTKFIFTNADIKHAETVLNILGIRDLFKDIICFESVMEDSKRLGIWHEARPVVCKPSIEAFEIAIQVSHCNPETTLFLDDSKRNIEGATKVGLKAVLVGSKNQGISAIAELETLHDLPKILPQLWQGGNQPNFEKGGKSANNLKPTQVYATA